MAYPDHDNAYFDVAPPEQHLAAMVRDFDGIAHLAIPDELALRRAQPEDSPTLDALRDHEYSILGAAMYAAAARRHGIDPYSLAQKEAHNDIGKFSIEDWDIMTFTCKGVRCALLHCQGRDSLGEDFKGDMISGTEAQDNVYRNVFRGWRISDLHDSRRMIVDYVSSPDGKRFFDVAQAIRNRYLLSRDIATQTARLQETANETRRRGGTNLRVVKSEPDA